MNQYRRVLSAAFMGVLFTLTSCLKEEPIVGGYFLEDWTEETHGENATPNYDVVFNQNEVLRIDLVIESDYWDAMQEDLTSIVGTGGGGPGGGGFSSQTPLYVPAQMYFNDKQWYDVGLRYKGNSSLSSAYQQGNGKLPLRIEMNHFENDNPNITGQTFYGFQQLSLSSGYKDESLVREKIAADVFRAFGVPAPQTAFYRVYIDHGDGPTYFGLYTMVEVVFDKPMLDTQFGNSYGNCYKPDSDAARLNDVSALSTVDMPNKTNEGASFDDITTLINTLLSDDRTNNPTQWRSNLESIIDMDMYLKYLAANTTMKNWDTYGRMTHNYYLYNNPNVNKFTWIPWDNNETFTDGPGGGGGPGGGMSALSFDFNEIMTTQFDTWPMITYVYNDAVYKAQYDAYIDAFIADAFSVSNMTTRFTNAHNLVQQYVNGTDGEIDGYTFTTSTDFDNSLSTLINFVNTQVTDAANYTP